MDNVSKNKNNEKAIDKCIKPNSFGIDLNILKAPMFLYNNYKPKKDEKGKIITQLEEQTYQWIDSKNVNRKLYMYCKDRLPRQFESDVLFALVGLFIRKNAPFPYDYTNEMYEINVNKVEFSWYELAMFLKVEPTGYYIKKMKDAVRILKQTQYLSYEEGALFDKQHDEYIKSGEEGLSLISKYKFKTIKKVAENNEYSTEINNNYVIFDELIINNLRYEYFKYLNIDLYFVTIPSGLERGIYSYLEANRYDSNNKPLLYIKRSNQVLKYSIPIEYTYLAEMKRRTTKPYDHLKKIGYLKDYEYGDVLCINGIKEDCTYFCFGITALELKKMLERKKNEQLKLNLGNIVSKNKKDYLKLPSNDLLTELINRGVESVVASNLIKEHDKWDIIKYIIWFDKEKQEGNVKVNSGGLMRFSIEKSYPIEEKYPEIIEFIKSNKLTEENSIKKNKDDIESKYKSYVNNEIQKFIKTDNPEYKILYDIILKDLNKTIDTRIRESKLLNQDISMLEGFKKEQQNSKLFKDMLIKELKVYLKLKSIEEFRNNIS